MEIKNSVIHKDSLNSYFNIYFVLDKYYYTQIQKL